MELKKNNWAEIFNTEIQEQIRSSTGKISELKVRAVEFIQSEE